MMTENEKALLKALLKTAIFSIDCNCEVTGKVRLMRENEHILLLDFTVSDDLQPHDVFGEPEHIYICLEIDRIEAHPFGPEIIFKNLKTAKAFTARHTYYVVNVRLDGAPEVFIAR